jgi:hypothetical protein
MAKIFTRAHVPEALVQKWLQHLRDFDTANPDCHFEVCVDASDDKPLDEIVRMLQVEPELTFTRVFERKKS